MKISSNDVKVKYLAVSKLIFNAVIMNHNMDIKDIAYKLKLPENQVKTHVNKLFKAGFLTKSHNKTYQAANVLKFKAHQDEELDKYLANNAMKNKLRSVSHAPPHIQEAIARGLISKDMIHTHCPMDDTPEHFKNSLTRTHKNLAWHGYSIYNMFNS